MNFATGSATPPSTVMAIMPTRSFPPGEISDAGVVCPNATPGRPASNAIERRIRRMCSSPERIVDRNCTGVPVPKFAGICSTLSCELRNQRDTSKSNVLVPPGSRSSQSDSRHGGANFGFGAPAYDDESNYGPGTEGTPACNCSRTCGTLRAGERRVDEHRTAEVLAAGRLRMGRDQAMQCSFYTGTCSPAAPFFHASTERFHRSIVDYRAPPLHKGGAEQWM